MKTKYHPNGAVKSITYWTDGLWHRDNGPDRFAEQNSPAYQRRNDSGKLIMEIWHQNDRGHRDNVPAFQWWNTAGELIYEAWLQNGRELTPQENTAVNRRGSARGL